MKLLHPVSWWKHFVFLAVRTNLSSNIPLQFKDLEKWIWNLFLIFEHFKIWLFQCQCDTMSFQHLHGTLGLLCGFQLGVWMSGAWKWSFPYIWWWTVIKRREILWASMVWACHSQHCFEDMKIWNRGLLLVRKIKLSPLLDVLHFTVSSVYFNCSAF